MVWFKADDQLSRSKKVLRIPRRYRMQAMGLWILSGTWSAGELTDGFVPSHMLDELGGTAAQAKRLVESGLWSEVTGGFQFNSWSDFQPSSNDVRAKRARDAERKQKAREEKRRRSMQAADQGESEGVRADSERTERGVHAESTRSPQSVRSTRPDPSRPDPLKEGGKVVREVTGGERDNAPPSLIPDEWLENPRLARCAAHAGIDDPPPCVGCRDARRAAEEAGHARAREQMARAAAVKAERDACELCDPAGFILDVDEAIRCTHDPDRNGEAVLAADTARREREAEEQRARDAARAAAEARARQKRSPHPEPQEARRGPF